MEHFITSFSYADSLFAIKEENVLTVTFSLEQNGEALVHFTSSVPAGDWGVVGRESAVVTVELNGKYNQDLILFNGAEAFTYERMLGRLPAGEHELTFKFRADMSSKLIKEALVHMIEIRQVMRWDPEIVFYENAPVIYGRNLLYPFENRYTDTPLLLFYYCDHAKDGTMTIEYHIIFSHEDGGTAAHQLMSKWGRTSDIEWVYRVKLDSYGNRMGIEGTEVFQGAEHVTTAFRGERDLGIHPILQASTDNGNFSDQVSSNYRYLLKPFIKLERNVNREAVMDLCPWTYSISVKEIRRQVEIERRQDHNTAVLSDPSHYLFIQTAKYTEGNSYSQGKVDFKVKLFNSNSFYSSVHNDPNMAYDGDDGPFSTTVKLPEGTSVGDIEEILVCYIEETGAMFQCGVKILGIRKAFFLGGQDVPVLPFIISEKLITVSAENPEEVIWSNLGTERR